MSTEKTLEAILCMKGEVSPSFKKSIKVASATMADLGGNLKSSGIKIGQAVAAGTAASMAAITAVSTAAIKNAGTMQKEMSNVATLLDGTTQEIDGRIAELQSGILDISNKLNIDTSDLTDGLYQVISAVGDTEDSLNNLTISAQAAKAGNATTTDAINLLTAVTKGYGDTSKEAFEKTSDLAFQTVKLGQTSFPELAANIGKVTPLASALQVSQEELFGASATLTGVTGGTAEVMTQLKAVLSGLMSPSQGMAGALEQLGYSSGSAAIESLGLQGTLDALSGTVDGDTQQLAKMFSSVEAQTAILALAGTQSQNFADKTQAMYDAAGATNKAFAAQTDNIDYEISALKNLGKNFLTEIGLVALPEVENLAKAALPMVTEGLKDIAPEVGDMAAQFTQNILPLVADLLPGTIDTIKAVTPAISEIVATAVPATEQIITTAAPIAADLLPVVADGISTVVGYVGENIDTIERLLPVIGAVVLGYKGFTTGIQLYNAGMAIYNMLTATSASTTATLGVAEGGTAASTTAMGAAAAGATASTATLGTAEAGATASTAALGVAEGGVTASTTAMGVAEAGATASTATLGTAEAGATASTAALGVAEGGVTASTTAMGVAAAGASAPTAAFGVTAGGAAGPTAALGASILSVTWPILAIIAVIALLVAAVILVVKHFDKIKAAAVMVGNALKAVGQTIADFFVGCFEGVVAAIKLPFNIAIAMINGIAAKINGLKISIPDWVPGFGGKTFSVNIPTLPMLAKGGFTAGPSIAGEDGEEAVISFKKSVRRQNIGYWADAGERLGIDFSKIYDTFALNPYQYAGGNRTYELGDIEYNPTIIIQGSATKEDINSAMSEQKEEFFDRLDEWWGEKTGGDIFDPRF